MDCWDRPTLAYLDERPPLSIIKTRPLPQCLEVENPIGTTNVETHHSVTHDLQANPANPRRRAAAGTILNLGQCQKTSRMFRAVRHTRQSPQCRSVKIIPQTNR